MLVGYARVSTTDQDTEMQIAALENGRCEKVFSETASGAKADRPQLIAALEFMREGDTLVVWKLDRLARSTKQLLQTVELLQERGVQLRSQTEAIDTSTAGGFLVFTVFSAIAQFERELIRERTRAGLALARAKGRVGGRPRALSGDDVTTIDALWGKITVAQIAKQLGVSPSTIYKHRAEAVSAAA